MIIIEKHNGIKVLRDDLLIGGTKSILMPYIVSNEYDEYVYASPVYGGFQIALSAYCQSVNKKATIFCAKRKELHDNTKRCIDFGAEIIQVPYGYLSNVEKHAKDYSFYKKAKKLEFGAKTSQNIEIISNRVKEVIFKIGAEPDEIWCAIGSGTLVESILKATSKSRIYGVQVGANYYNNNPRLSILKYPKSFDKISKYKCDFNSMPNYDLKAYEFCVKFKKTENVLFWNVL